MRKHLFVFLAVLFLITARFPQQVHANVSASSAALVNPSASQTAGEGSDQRVKVLQRYLQAHNSPLTQNAGTFVSEADKNDLDWRLVAAISGVESTFGQHIPPASYNGWGFGIYGDHVLRFNSWDNGIATVSKSLKEDYIDKNGAKDVYQIGRIYAASPTWAYRVQLFMNDIDNFSIKTVNAKTLSISL